MPFHLLYSLAMIAMVNDPSSMGQWSGVIPFEVVAVHAHLLPTGKVLYWDRHDQGDGTPRLWDPESGTIMTVSGPGGHEYDIFCSGHSFLKDGKLLVAGGHVVDYAGLATASTYDPFTNTWTRHPDMNAGRWYPTNTTLASGDVLTISGNIDLEEGVNLLPQVFQANTRTWRDLSGAERSLPLYPFMYLAPNGKVFTAGPQPLTSYLDTSGTGAWTDVAPSLYGFRDYGSSVMYGEGKILIAGGSPPPHVLPPTASAEVIDLGALVPAWTPTGSMAHARRQLNTTLLPDGTVLVTGGTSATGFNNSTGAVLDAELWDPATGAWRTLASMQVPRIYHSVALLLPDGRVLSAGGGHPSDAVNGDPDHPDAEIYSPPYLFQGPRPLITSAPEAVPYGTTFFVGTSDSIASVTLIRLSSVTHGFNQDQRIVRLSFDEADGGLAVTAPSDPNLCPPGYYMLFLLNGSGVPSVASILRIDPDLVGADLDFHTLEPCRLVDTRDPDGPLGGPDLQPYAQRTFILAGTCGVPPDAKALSVNLTTVIPGAGGHLSVFPADRPDPMTSTISFTAGQNRANNALLPLSGDGTGSISITVTSADALHFVLDVNGYFQ
ncbi:MAG TPA: galactose oxidase-like domain-containing protein [Thermoanaerobaculia bacterium]|nr:galactose oxidase-like domain-containing protein [Thermoanaerobaculia bacterium]